VDLTLDAGADGVFYDNNLMENLAAAYREMYAYGSARKSDLVLAGNFHTASYVMNRLTNALSTEDAEEPGVYSPANVTGRLATVAGLLAPVDGGLLVNNLGLYRVHRALSDGWKPIFIEPGRRETGSRFVRPIPAGRHQLALAEAMMSGVALQLFSEGAFANGLMRGHADALEIWRAIGRYNRFFADNERYYVDVRPMARLAVVLDDRSEGVPLLDALAGRNVLFDVVYEHDLSPEKLRPYSAVALLHARRVRQRALAALQGFVERGGKLLASADAAAQDERGRPRERPAWFAKGRAVQTAPPGEELPAALKAAAGDAVKLEAPAGVVCQPVMQRDRLLIHLLNYSPLAREGIGVTLPSKYKSVRLLSPDETREAVALRQGRVELRRLVRYALLVCE